MKKFFKRVPALVVVSLIIVLTVVSAFAVANISVTQWITDYVSGNNPADVDGNGQINILDAIALYNKGNQEVESDGFTKGIY